MLQKFHCEHVFEELGNCGYYQKLLFAGLIIPFSVLVALQSNILHNELVPDHWCRVKILENFSYGEQHRLIRPTIKTSIDGKQMNSVGKQSNCEMYDIDYAVAVSGLEVTTKNISSSTIVPTKKCDQGWVYNRNVYEDSASMHYNFVCDDRDKIHTINWIRNVASALVSPLYGLFADRCGRKLALWLILFVYLVSSISPIFTFNYYAFVTCQAVNGSAFPIALLIMLIFGIEFMTPQYRTFVLAYSGIAFHFGQWISFLLTHTLSNWVWITICNSILVVPYFILLHFVDESPQWLLAQNQPKKLKTVFSRLNQINLARLDDDSLNSIVSKFTHFSNFKQCQEENRSNTDSTSTQQTKIKSTLTDCGVDDNGSNVTDENNSVHFFERIRLFIKRSTLFQTMLLFSFVLITNELTADFLSRQHRFYDNILVDKFFGSLIKMPVIFFIWYMIGQRIGRRWSNCIVLLINLLLLLTLMIGRRWVKNTIWFDVTISEFGIMLTKCSIMITVLQTIELSPTRYRTIIVSIVYLIAKLITIYLIDTFNNPNLRLILNFYTKSIMLSGMTLLAIIVTSFVAETRNEFLPLNLLASEQLITNVHYWSLSKKKSDIAPSNLFLSLSKWDINCNHQIVGSIKHLEKFTDS